MKRREVSDCRVSLSPRRKLSSLREQDVELPVVLCIGLQRSFLYFGSEGEQIGSDDDKRLVSQDALIQ